MIDSLTEPSGSSPLVGAAQWIESTLLGTAATAVAVIAVATVGTLMLTGRLNVRRAVVVIVGCFVLFGAPSIAAGIQAMLAGSDNPSQASPSEPVPPSSPLPPAPLSSIPYDPYAGAAVPTTR